MFWRHFVHGKYRWALEEHLGSSSSPVARLSEMPSLVERAPDADGLIATALQGLFRVEEQASGGGGGGDGNGGGGGDRARVCVWATARSPFELLDEKDSFVLALQRSGVADCAPTSHVLAWDAADPARADASVAAAEAAGVGVPAPPADALVIKPACGSRGDGIGYVQCARDALGLLAEHAAKGRAAEQEGRFLARLRAEYEGRVPGWVLQQRIVPFGGPKKPAWLRAHVAYVRRRGERRGTLHVFREVEVRKSGFGGRSQHFGAARAAAEAKEAAEEAGGGGVKLGAKQGADDEKSGGCAAAAAHHFEECGGGGGGGGDDDDDDDAKAEGVGAKQRPWELHNEFRSRGETERLLVEDWPELAAALGGRGAPRVLALLDRFLRGLHGSGELDRAVGVARARRLSQRRATIDRKRGRTRRAREQQLVDAGESSAAPPPPAPPGGGAAAPAVTPCTAAAAAAAAAGTGRGDHGLGSGSGADADGLDDWNDVDAHADTVALAAVDLMLSADEKQLGILEINHRPAMVQPSAPGLQPAFAAHVVRMIGGLFELGRGFGGDGGEGVDGSRRDGSGRAGAAVGKDGASAAARYLWREVPGVSC
jgi:hypothetical protein